MKDPTMEKRSTLYLLTCCSCIGGFLFGYDTGVISGALVSLQNGGVDTFRLSAFESETIVSAAIVGAILGAVGSGYGNARYGRKPMILLSSVLFTIGAICMGLAESIRILVSGRLIVGLAIGISSMTIPVYIAEASLPNERGTLVSLNTLMITGGQFFAAVFDGVLSTTPSGWRYMLGLIALPSFIQLICFFYLPESPRWLKEKGRDLQARSVLQYLRMNGTNIEMEWDQLVHEAPRRRETNCWSELQHPVVYRALSLGCSLQVLQQLCGINTVMYYGATIIQMAGFANPSTAIWLSAVVALSNFAFTLVGIYLVDRLGRRPLTLWSLAGVILSLYLLGISFFMAENTSPSLTGVGVCRTMSNCFDCIANNDCGVCGSHCVPGTVFSPAPGFNCPVYFFDKCPYSTSSIWSIVILFALFLYLGCFASGMGCMPWTINAEIYPLNVRSIAISIATTSNWLSNLLVSYTFLMIVSILGPHGTFLIYGIIGTIGFTFFYFYLPETKGIPLEDISLLFQPSTHHNYQPLY